MSEGGQTSFPFGQEWPTVAVRRWKDEDQKRLLEATRGWGENKLVSEKLPVGKTTIYLWRKKHWGTMRADGDVNRTGPGDRTVRAGGPKHILRTSEEKARAVKEALASGRIKEWGVANGIAESQIHRWKREGFGTARPNGKAKEPAASERVGTDGRKYRTQEEKARLVKEALASRNLKEWAATNGVAAASIRKWSRGVGLQRPGKPRVGANGVSPDDAELLAADAAERDSAKADRLARSGVLKELEQLRLETTVQKAIIGLAINKGFLDMFDLTKMFGWKKGG